MAIFTFKQALDKHGVSADQVTNVTKPVTPLQPTQQTAQDGFFSGVASDFNSRVDTAANAQIKSAQGDQSNASGIFQTLGQGAGLVSDIVGRGFNTATGGLVSKAIQKGSEFVPQVIADKGAEAVTAYQGWKDQHPEAAANLEAGVNLGTLLPVGALTKGVAEGGVKATLIGSGKALEVGAGALSVPGRVIRGAGSTLYKTAITPTVQEAEHILAYRAKTPFLTRVSQTLDNSATPPLTRAQTALEQGLAGTETAVGVQAKRVADMLWQKEIAPAVKNSTATMTKDELFTPALERIAATTDPTRKTALQDAYDALLQDYVKFPESFDLTKAQALKQDIATFTPTKIFKGKEVANEMRTLQADMAGAIRSKTYSALADEGIKKKYLDWGNLDELQKVGVKAISEGSFKGGSGTLLSGLWDMATTPIKTIGGQVLYRVGDKLEFSAPKGIKTLGQYLKAKGYAKPTEYALPSTNPSIGMSIKDISQIHPDDAKFFQSIIDAKTISTQDAEIARKTLEHYGLQSPEGKYAIQGYIKDIYETSLNNQMDHNLANPYRQK